MSEPVGNVYFIGGGNMAEAIVRAGIAHGALDPDAVRVTDISERRVEHLASTYHVHAGAGFSAEAVAEADLVVLAVRPQDDLAGIGALVGPALRPGTVVVSIVAGVTIERLEGYLGPDSHPVVRIIPNTLTDTGHGYSGVALNGSATRESVEAFLTSFGKVQYIDEGLLDVFTGFGVAGPNYVYCFVEALVDGGVLAGLTHDQARAVVLENLVGSAAMLEAGHTPRELLDINNSPGGVGINLVAELNAGGFAATLQRAVLRAVETTTRLGRGAR